MKILLTIFLLLFFLFGKAQQDDKTRAFLNYVRERVFKEDSLFYTEDLNDITLAEMRKHLLKDTIWIYKQLGEGKLQRIDSIILSKYEKKYIEEQLAEQAGKIWNDNLLEKSKLTSRDTTYKKYGYSRLPNDYKPKTIYSFSRPIFLREDSICYFYYQEVQAGLGYGQLGLYRSENGKWKFIQWFYSWSGGGY